MRVKKGGKGKGGKSWKNLFVSRTLVYSTLALSRITSVSPFVPATREGNSAGAVILIRWTLRVNLTEIDIRANNVGLIQFAATVIVLHWWESMYSKQREYAILLVTSDFIPVTNFIYPEMVIRFLVDESKGKRENKGNRNTRIHGRVVESC